MNEAQSINQPQTKIYGSLDPSSYQFTPITLPQSSITSETTFSKKDEKLCAIYLTDYLFFRPISIISNKTNHPTDLQLTLYNFRNGVFWRVWVRLIGLMSLFLSSVIETHETYTTRSLYITSLLGTSIFVIDIVLF